jgi:hypothetical protein
MTILARRQNRGGSPLKCIVGQCPVKRDEILKAFMKGPQVRRVTITLCLYGLIFISVVALASQPFYHQNLPAFPIIRYGDLIEFLYFMWAGVIVFFLLYLWIPEASSSTKAPSVAFLALFWGFSLLHVAGRSIHLAANSIHGYVTSPIPENLHRSIFFYDEIVSDTLLYGAALALACVTVVYQDVYRTYMTLSRIGVVCLVIFGLFYGFGFGFAVLEGQTAGWQWPLFLLVVVLMGLRLIRIRSEALRLPAWIFFLSGFLLMLIILGGWFIYFGDFVEPSEVLGNAYHR